MSAIETSSHDASTQKGLEHLIKCAKEAFPSSHPGLSKEDATLLIKRMDCVSYLGGGTFGSVFETSSPVGEVVKFIPRRTSKSKLPCDAAQEFKMQKRFARHGLAWAPRDLRHFQLSGNLEQAEPWVGLDVIRMEKVASTLDKTFRDGYALRFTEEASSLGKSMAKLVSEALVGGLVHHDAKCNNIGVSKDGDLRFIDFGRAFDEKALKSIGLSRKKINKALRLGAAIDAWRFQESVSRWLLRVMSKEAHARLFDFVVGPLRDFALDILKEDTIVPGDFLPPNAWWTDEEVFKTLKASFSSCIRVPRRKPYEL